MKKLKILWVNYVANNLVINIIKKINTEKYDIGLILNQDTVNNNINSIKYYILKTDKNTLKLLIFPLYILKIFKRYKVQSMPLIKGLNKFLMNKKPDLVTTNTLFRPYTWQVAFYKNKYDYLFFIHTQIQNFSKNKIKYILEGLLIKTISRYTIKQATLILPWTRLSMTFLKKEFPEYKNKIKLMPAGVDTDIFYPKNKKNKKKLHLLMVARFVGYKRHIDLIKAVKILKDKNIDFKLNLLGEGKLKPSIKKEIKKLNLTQDIFFLKKISYKKMKDLYSSHDILILPSHNEAIGMCVPEAMACATTCIVSDTVGAEMYIKNNMNGHIFKTYCYKELAQKIIDLKLKTKQFGNNAKKHITKNYSTTKVAKIFEKHVKEASE